ncbi:MAG: hypothetical protein Kow00117_08490 [Phototrophicales bacterium]
MISLRVWTALLTPFVAHPLYQRWGVWTPSDNPTSGIFQKIKHFINNYEFYWFSGIIFLLILLSILTSFWTVITIVFIVPFLLACIMVPFLLLTGGIIYGLTSGLIIGNAIINEKIQGRYELIGLTNYGFEGVIWALCSLSIQRSQLLRQLREAYKVLFFISLIIVVIPLVMVGSISPFNNEAVSLEIVGNLILTMLATSALAIEFIQSSNIGGLLGILVSNYAKTRTDTRNMIIVTFISLQLVVYISIGFLSLLIYPDVFSVLGWDLAMARYQILYASFCLFTFYIIREIIITLLWHRLADITNVELYELDHITHVGIKEGLIPHILRRKKQM